MYKIDHPTAYTHAVVAYPEMGVVTVELDNIVDDIRTATMALFDGLVAFGFESGEETVTYRLPHTEAADLVLTALGYPTVETHLVQSAESANPQGVAALRALAIGSDDADPAALALCRAALDLWGAGLKAKSLQAFQANFGFTIAQSLTLLRVLNFDGDPA